jgi:hypothetical protein
VGGWRAIPFAAAGETFLQSRTGKALAYYFPDLMGIARTFLSAGVVLDGELVIWDPSRERTSFAMLHRRITSMSTSAYCWAGRSTLSSPVSWRSRSANASAARSRWVPYTPSREGSE